MTVSAKPPAKGKTSQDGSKTQRGQMLTLQAEKERIMKQQQVAASASGINKPTKGA